MRRRLTMTLACLLLAAPPFAWAPAALAGEPPAAAPDSVPSVEAEIGKTSLPAPRRENFRQFRFVEKLNREDTGSDPAAPAGSSEIALNWSSGMFIAAASINHAPTLNFVIDSGAADVTITADVLENLMRTGAVAQADFLGKKTYRLADGSTVPSQTFRIRTLRVGDREIDNVVAGVTNANGSMLLGQSFLSRFKSWSIDNEHHVLVLR